MLKEKMRWIYFSEMLEDELRQCQGEGREIKGFRQRITEVSSMREGADKEEMAKDLLLEMETAPIKSDYFYCEPETYEQITASLLPAANKNWKCEAETWEDKLAGALYGRVIGCVMGIPVEGWERERILGYLKATGQYPLKTFISSTPNSELRKKFSVREYDPSTPYDRQIVCWRNCLTEYPVDDDLNYTLLALKVLERYGEDFTMEDIAETWMLGIPAFHACTAERVAIRNLMTGVLPPASARVANPYREWIGAQIRGDMFGYIRPGNPQAAAELAFRDGAVSHIKNGIYGEMFIAAWLSMCYVEGLSMLERVKIALEQIPPKSRLREAVAEICGSYERGESLETVFKHIHTCYNESIMFDWCHTIPNTMIVTACMLWCDTYTEAVASAICCGFDTDCNGATVGSIFGLAHGLAEIPVELRYEFPSVIHTSVHGYHEMNIDDILKRTSRFFRHP